MRRSTTVLIGRWTAEGPVSLERLCKWRDEDGWGESWLAHCEQALASQEEELLRLLEAELNLVEAATFTITKSRLEGVEANELLRQVEAALLLAKNPDSRDLALEGRLRMERGLAHIECGDMESARDDLTWAETRLKSVSKAGRDHDISLLNKAAFHVLVDEPLMALQVYSDIPRDGEHIPETIAFSRYGAAQLYAHLGQFNAALRHAWVAFTLADESGLIDLTWACGTTFLVIGAESLDDSAQAMAIQVEEATPRSVGEENSEPGVTTAEYLSVFHRCVELWDGEVDGNTRQDLMGLLSAALMLDEMDEISDLFKSPEALEDPFLIAAIMQVVDEEESPKWQHRLTSMMTLSTKESSD